MCKVTESVLRERIAALIADAGRSDGYHTTLTLPDRNTLTNRIMLAIATEQSQDDGFCKCHQMPATDCESLGLSKQASDDTVAVPRQLLCRLLADERSLYYDDPWKSPVEARAERAQDIAATETLLGFYRG